MTLMKAMVISIGKNCFNKHNKCDKISL